MRAPFAAVLLASTFLATLGCAGMDEQPKTPKKNIGQPAPTAVTSAEPLWLSNDPNRKQSPTDTQVAR